MTTKPNVLTVERYKFYKTQETPLTDAKIAEIFNLNINQLNAFKKENDLVGKFDVKKTRVNDVKTYKASELKKEEPTADKTETPLLKENDITAKQSLQKTIEEYEANKKVKEKLDARKEVLPLVQASASAGEHFKQIGQAVSNALDTTAQIETESFTEVKDQLKQKLVALEKEKAWLEEQHVKDTAEKDELRDQLEKVKQESNFAGLILKVSEDVKAERFRQNSLFGYQRHPNGDWLMILMEEVGEVAQAMQTEKGWGKETDAGNLYEELIHVAAVASAIAAQVWEEQTQ